MKKRLSSIELFEEKKVNFVDREEIRKIVRDECNELIKKGDRYFRVIDIYGLGGMGKTSLLHTLKSEISDIIPKKKSLIVDVSFEIDKRQSLKSLISIRKQIHKRCVFFDYALTRYWEKAECNVKLDDSFMSEIRDPFWKALSLTDTIADVSNVDKPSLSGIFLLVDKILQKIRQALNHEEINSINGLESHELLKNLPYYLGYDIGKIVDAKRKLVVFLCDSYQQSVPYSESKEWLLDLVSEIHTGLFVITGRERLKWEDDDNNVEKEIKPYELKCFPPEVAREYITAHIDDPQPDVVDRIISSTKCLPLFIDIALKVYKNESASNIPVNIAYFNDLDSMMKGFMHHLPEKWHSMIRALSVVKVFNRKIFDELAYRFGRDCPLEDYKEIVYSSLTNYIAHDKELVKFHDLFCDQATKVLPLDFKQDVWQYYLGIIHREMTTIYNGSQEDLVTLFLNLIQCCIDMNLSVTSAEAEKILDILFTILDKRIYFEPPAIDSSKDENITNILKMIKAVMDEKINSVETVKTLESISDPQLFGKHYNSYHIKLLYYKSLNGNYSDLIAGIREMNSNFDESDKRYWYYSYTKMYFSDYLTMDGKFKSALENLTLLNNEELSASAKYDVNRAIGHIYRFNMMLDIAQNTYRQQLSFVQSVSAEIHLKTNLCETLCFFDPKEFDKLYDETLAQAAKSHYYRNMGKLYYSKAIVLIKKRNYEKANKFIDKSIEVNQNIGYESGELFALIARAYCDYAKSGRISNTTLNAIDKLLDKNQVYRFFKLPICIMQKNNTMLEQLRDKFEWLDFESTVACFKRFINSLRPLDQK